MLGLAIGDAMGAPADGMTPYEVMRKFKQVDAFFISESFGQEAGSYTRETRAALVIAKPLASSGTLTPQVIEQVLSEFDHIEQPIKGETARVYFSHIVPIGLYAAIGTVSDQDVANLVKAIAVRRNLTRPDILAGIVFALAVKEIIRNRETLTNPYELYDSDKSMAARLFGIAMKAQMKFEVKDLDDMLSERLEFVRKRLMNRGIEGMPVRFYGIMGNRPMVKDALCRAFFSFWKAPDEFSTICQTVTMGGCASLDGALVGALIGAYIGASGIAPDMKDQVKNGPKIENLATAMVDSCLPKQDSQPVQEKTATPEE